MMTQIHLQVKEVAKRPTKLTISERIGAHDAKEMFSVSFEKGGQQPEVSFRKDNKSNGIVAVLDYKGGSSSNIPPSPAQA